MSSYPACKLGPTVSPVENPGIPHFSLDGGECKCQECTLGKGQKEGLEEKMKKALPSHFFRMGADQVFEPYPKAEPILAAQVNRPISPLRKEIKFTV